MIEEDIWKQLPTPSGPHICYVLVLDLMRGLLSFYVSTAGNLFISAPLSIRYSY